MGFIWNKARLWPVLFLSLGLLFVLSIWAVPSAGAQDSNSIEAPGFSVTDLEALKAEVEASSSLSEDQKTIAVESLDGSVSSMLRASGLVGNEAQYRRELENSPETIEGLRTDIQELQARELPEFSDMDDMTGDEVLQLEQDLIARESELRNLRAEQVQYENELASLLQRPLSDELTDASSRLSEVTSELNTIGDTDQGLLERTRRASLEARQYVLRAQVAALEQDIASRPARQQILTLRRDLAQINAQRVQQIVVDLQNKTGQRRLSNARSIYEDAEQALSALESSHPFLIYFGAGNLTLTQEIVDIAEASSSFPVLQAETRRRRDEIKNNLDVASQLTELGQINRQSSATLRRLRNQRPPVSAVRSEINETRKSIIDATQKRLWAQEQLRQLPIGELDSEVLMEDWRKLNPDAPPLTESDYDILKSLYTARRNILLEISDSAFFQISEAGQLETVQNELLTHTSALSELLDQKLLWLPSVQAVNWSWPQKVIRGTGKVFDFDNLNRAGTVFIEQLNRWILMVIVLVGLAAMMFLLRPRFWADIVDRSKKVGRVQRDSYWHTPSVIIATVLRTSPLPILVFLLGLLFSSSDNPHEFISALGQTGVELSGFFWFFLMWREWNFDDALFDKHYKLNRTIRHAVMRQLRWFIPFAGITITLVTLTQNSREPDVYEGFSLLLFMITACALSYFAYKILWAKRGVFGANLSETHFLNRYRHAITFIVVALPVLAALLAAAGYYDTARELLSRLFFSGGLVIATYVAYGLIRRTVVVAQRRIALRQALERREKILKAREEQEAAEERGELPPPVDYEEIDLESLSRQSNQLLNTMILIGFAVLMWIFWQDLLPALSIFDNVNLWSHSVLEEDGTLTRNSITLWNLIQALVILGLTLIASRNLPGFLEVFVLNRSRLDSGTRYAIVGVLGYIIVAIGLVMAFNRLGTQWSQLQWVVAALGVGVGFGLQEIIANFISGLIILFERPVRVGDYVTIGDQSGTVTRIQIRATTLGDLDNREILIPNKSLITERVTNWTLSNSITRLIVPVGVAYGSDTDQVQSIISDVVKANERVLDSPRPQVLFLGFGDSSLDFEVRAFLKTFEDRFPVSHALHTEINRALAKANITIPFPQRDLHIISPPDGSNSKET